MPARNIVKEYLPDSYYHIYNRGVEKRIIFQDEADYKVFLSYLKLYLSPPPELPKEISDQYRAIAEKLQLNNYCNEIKLSAFCLIPNHFHLLIKQNPVNGINRFMQSLCTKYSMYFNKKHKRIGKLFQGHYKAVLVKTEEQLLHLSRYIHLNPVANLKLNSSQINQKLAIPAKVSSLQTSQDHRST